MIHKKTLFLVSMLLLLISSELFGQSREAMNSKITLISITLATTNMDEMKIFYEKVFFVEFSEIEMYGGILYEGNFAGLKLLLCPAEIAKNTATQNRHQLELTVRNLTKLVSQVVRNNGKILEEINEFGNERKVSVSDPDNNSMVLVQKLK